ncbi:MAG: hypothetical protein KDC67_11990 [Ignavibacteriae bacterium]|nr:hypothetical protein [Ignavibacteriota bacterium]
MKIKERINVYICEYGCHNVTVDVDKGVTPFFINCMRTADENRPLDPTKSKDGVCIGLAKSCMYPKEIDDNLPYPTPKYEWYRPDLSQYVKLSDDEKDHVRNGGLLIRKRTDAKPLINGVDDWTWDDVKIPDYEAALRLERKSKSTFGKNYYKTNSRGNII